MENTFGLIPLGILVGIPQINRYAKSCIPLENDLITFAVGIKPPFNLNINDLIKRFDGEMKENVTNRENTLQSEIEEWLIRR